MNNNIIENFNHRGHYSLFTGYENNNDVTPVNLNRYPNSIQSIPDKYISNSNKKKIKKENTVKSNNSNLNKQTKPIFY